MFGRFTLEAPVLIRACREEDLEALEWFGQHAEHRDILRSAFEQQQRGEVVMLLAVLGGYPVSQVWINLALKREERIGALWAVRTFPFLRGLGIGTRLMLASEGLLVGRGYVEAELGVERDNPAARRFYERLGYVESHTVASEYSYTTPDGRTMRVPIDEWIMRKRLV